MSEAVIAAPEAANASNYPYMSIVQKCATAQPQGAVSDVTLDETSSSTMVQPHSVDVASSDEPCATPDHADTSEDVTGGADLCDVMHLSPKMHQALELLFTGHSASATARLIGVHRNTIGRWRTSQCGEDAEGSVGLQER